MSRPILIGLAAALLAAGPVLGKPAAASKKPAAKSATSAKATPAKAKKPVPQTAAKAVPLPRPAPKDGASSAPPRTLAYAASVPGAVPASLMTFAPGGASIPQPTAAPQPSAAVPEPVARPAAPTRSLMASLNMDVTGALGAGERLAPVSAEEIAALRSAIDSLKKGRLSDALALRPQLKDPGSLALLDWLAIRLASRQVGLSRIEWFLRTHPSWPGSATIRRRAEEALWNEDAEPAHVRAFFGATPPSTEEGKLALARALLAGGEGDKAAAWVRDAWRHDVTTPAFEDKLYERFGAMLTADDHEYRAERLFFAERVDQALRIAARAGGAYQAVAKARAAVIRNAKNAGALLEAVPREGRREPGYLIALSQYHRRADRPKEAAAALMAAVRDPSQLGDADEWWVERRLVARDMIEAGDPRTAYQLCRDHSAVSREDRAEAEFHAGWIALRFLKDPGTASRHFAALDGVAQTTLSRSRAAYWQGRAAEAGGDTGRARGHYDAASRFSTAYYGQLARARLGLKDLPLRAIPKPSAEDRAVFERTPAARALRILYVMKERDLAVSLAAAYAESENDNGQLALLAELVGQQMDVRSMLAVGKAALSRGLPLELLAYPTIGIPSFEARGNAVEASVVYAIARQESAFNPAAMSPVGARGLLQLMPGTAKITAKQAGLPYDLKRLTSDPVYNATLGAYHLGHLVDNYDGSYIMTFAAYNAGPGRVKQWVAKYGDPRSGQIDPIDWVELIPFTETRNYVQRVMENVQVYRARLANRSALLIEADLRRGIR
jgi:soluble lytic murein transglycosylase